MKSADKNPESTLTDRQLKHMEPAEKRVEIPAGPPVGLYAVIHPTGKKMWMYRYRYHGRPRGLTLTKPYPALTLAAARAEANAALDELKNGRDPAIRQTAEVEAEELKAASVGAVIDEFKKRALQAKEKERGETARILDKEAKAWRTRDIGSIGKPEVLQLLDSIVDRTRTKKKPEGASVMACRTRSVLIRLFKWARKRGYIETSPMVDVDKPGADHKDRERVLTDGELLEVWNAAETLPYPAGPFVRFLILTAQRRGEVATMEWPDVDVDGAMWTLPSEATKPGRVHDVPLSGAALAILKELSTWKGGDYLWTYSSGASPINSFSDVKEALDNAIAAARTKAGITKAIDAWTIHDLRRTAATGMAKAGVPPHVLSAILNHTPGSTQGVTHIYNRFRYTDERRAALQAWARHVDGLGSKVKQAAG